MKRFVFGTVFFFFGFMVFSSQAIFAAGEKYAFINVAKVFDEYQKTKDQDGILQEEGKNKESARAILVNEVRKMKDELELLSDDAKKSKQDAIDAKVRELQDFDMATRRELSEKRRKIVQEIFNDIDEVVRAYGVKKKIDLIFNDRALLYQNDKLDITEAILKELNKKYGKK